MFKGDTDYFRYCAFWSWKFSIIWSYFSPPFIQDLTEMARIRSRVSRSWSWQSQWPGFGETCFRGLEGAARGSYQSKEKSHKQSQPPWGFIRASGMLNEKQKPASQWTVSNGNTRIIHWEFFFVCFLFLNFPQEGLPFYEVYFSNFHFKFYFTHSVSVSSAGKRTHKTCYYYIHVYHWGFKTTTTMEKKQHLKPQCSQFLYKELLNSSEGRPLP